MISSDKINSKRELEQGIQERYESASIISNNNYLGSQNDSITETVNILETIRQSLLLKKSNLHQEFITDNKFNENVQKLIKYSPPIINPYFLDVDFEELPEFFLNYYKDFMEFQDEGGYYSTGVLPLLKNHDRFYDHHGFYKTERKFKYYEEDVFKEDRYMKPSYPIKSYGASRYAAMEAVNLPQVYLDKEDININILMAIYTVYYFDLFMNTFYPDKLKYYSDLLNISFVKKGTENAYTFDELKEIKVPGGTADELVGYLFTDYKWNYLTMEGPKNMHNFDFTKMTIHDFSFVLAHDDNNLLASSNSMHNATSTLASKNHIHFRVKREVLDEFETMDESKSEVVYSNLEKMFGWNKEEALNYCTRNVLDDLYSGLTQINRTDHMNNRILSDSYSWLLESDLVVDELQDEVNKLNELLKELD